MAAASLQSYLPRLVREWDEHAPGALHQAIDGSMVFVDVSGFTKMSERLARHGKVGAEEVTEVIGKTFAQLLEEAYAYGASLLKFGGDALLLFFPGLDHHLRACAAAYGMRRALRDIGKFRTTAGQVQLRMSVGVHAGTFDFFMVGGSHRELLVAGPCATATTEMESAAGAGQILVSRATAQLLPAANVGRAFGPGFLLRGEVDGGLRRPIEPARAAPGLPQFIPVGLRESLVAGQIEAEHRPAAVGFIHFMDFDRLVSTGGSGEAAAALDRLVRTVQAAADARGVTFLASDIAGDGGKIILTSGVPQTTGNDEEQMLLALADVVATDLPLPVQIGVNWGPVFAGEVGPGYRRTYTVMGDTVNLAARLMAKAGANQILTTREVLDGSRTLFEVEAKEPFLVKGKKLPIRAFVIGRPYGSRATDDAGIPLIGRDRELQALAEAWSSAESARGRVVELMAEPGMGKTRLLTEFLARTPDVPVHRSECRLYQAATPYFPFRELLRRGLGLEPGSPPETARALARLVEARSPGLLPWLALIGVVLDVDIPPSAEVAQLDDQFRPARTIAAVGALLEAVVVEPALFVIEDVHWMDESSRELLAGLLLGLERQPWMFILTRRPGSEGFVAPHSGLVSRIELQPLTIGQAEELINSATADHPLLPRQVAVLAERAAGNPLFLIELLRALEQGGDFEALPHSVEGLISARIDRLPTTDRHLLRRLAVLGNGFLAEHTGAVMPALASPDRVRALRRLGDFVTLNDKGWVQFRHALIRDVAYEGLPFKTRLELHARIGDSICGSSGGHPETQAELLSLHYFQARRWDDAWRYSRMAGDAAKAVYANQAAGTFYQRALAAARNLDALGDGERAAVARAMGDVLEQAGLYDEALDAYRRSLGLIDGDAMARADLLTKRAQVRMRKGAYALALRDTATGLSLVGDADTDAAAGARARLMSLRSAVRMAQQRPREALAMAEVAAQQARAAGELQALARALNIMDWAYFVSGQPEMVKHGAQAVEIYESLGLLDKAADVINNLGGFAYFSGRWDESIALYTKSRDTYLRAGNDVLAAMVGANIGEVLVSQGKLAEAEPILEDAVRVLRAAENHDDAVNAELHLAHLVAERGEITRATTMLEKVRQDALDLGQTLFAFEAGLYLASCRLRGGDALGALALIAAAATSAGEEAEFFEAKRARIAASALVELGRLDEAAAELESGLKSAQELGLPHDEALIRVALVSLARAKGEEPDESNVTEANRLLSRLGMEQAVAVSS